MKALKNILILIVLIPYLFILGIFFLLTGLIGGTYQKSYKNGRN